MSLVDRRTEPPPWFCVSIPRNRHDPFPALILRLYCGYRGFHYHSSLLHSSDTASLGTQESLVKPRPQQFHLELFLLTFLICLPCVIPGIMIINKASLFDVIPSLLFGPVRSSIGSPPRTVGPPSTFLFIVVVARKLVFVSRLRNIPVSGKVPRSPVLGCTPGTFVERFWSLPTRPPAGSLDIHEQLNILTNFL